MAPEVIHEKVEEAKPNYQNYWAKSGLPAGNNKQNKEKPKSIIQNFFFDSCRLGLLLALKLFTMHIIIKKLN